MGAVINKGIDADGGMGGRTVDETVPEKVGRLKGCDVLRVVSVAQNRARKNSCDVAVSRAILIYDLGDGGSGAAVVPGLGGKGICGGEGFIIVAVGEAVGALLAAMPRVETAALVAALVLIEELAFGFAKGGTVLAFVRLFVGVDVTRGTVVKALVPVLGEVGGDEVVDALLLLEARFVQRSNLFAPCFERDGVVDASFGDLLLEFAALFHVAYLTKHL